MGVIEYVGSIGGVAGVLAFLIFIAYKHLVQQMRQDRKFIEDRMSQVIGEYNRTTSENTKVLTELIVWLKLRNGAKV